MEQELEVFQASIHQRYGAIKENIQSKIDTKNNEIDDLAEKIARSSYFNSSFLDALADMMTTFEGREYSRQRTEYNPEEYNNEEWKEGTKYIEVIVLEEAKQDFYDDCYKNSLKDLIDLGQIIVFSTQNNDGHKDIRFYEVDTKNHSLTFTVKMDKFAYLKEFIDIVIDWKASNNRDFIPDQKLVELEREYLRKNKAKILLNYNMRANEERKVFEQRQEERKTNLNKKLSLNN